MLLGRYVCCRACSGGRCVGGRAGGAEGVHGKRGCPFRSAAVPLVVEGACAHSGTGCGAVARCGPGRCDSCGHQLWPLCRHLHVLLRTASASADGCVVARRSRGDSRPSRCHAHACVTCVAHIARHTPPHSACGKRAGFAHTDCRCLLASTNPRCCGCLAAHFCPCRLGAPLHTHSSISTWMPLTKITKGVGDGRGAVH